MLVKGIFVDNLLIVKMNKVKILRKLIALFQPWLFKRIPFSVSIDSFYSNENIKVLENSINEVNNGKVIVKSIEDLEAME